MEKRQKPLESFGARVKGAIDPAKGANKASTLDTVSSVLPMLRKVICRHFVVPQSVVSKSVGSFSIRRIGPLLSLARAFPYGRSGCAATSAGRR